MELASASRLTRRFPLADPTTQMCGNAAPDRLVLVATQFAPLEHVPTPVHVGRGRLRLADPGLISNPYDDDGEHRKAADKAERPEQNRSGVSMRWRRHGSVQVLGQLHRIIWRTNLRSPVTARVKMNAGLQFDDSMLDGTLKNCFDEFERSQVVPSVDFRR